MLTLGEKVRKIRSKNAGPFWITIDIFCGNKKIYKEVCNKLTNSEIQYERELDELLSRLPENTISINYQDKLSFNHSSDKNLVI